MTVCSPGLVLPASAHGLPCSPLTVYITYSTTYKHYIQPVLGSVVFLGQPAAALLEATSTCLG